MPESFTRSSASRSCPRKPSRRKRCGWPWCPSARAASSCWNRLRRTRRSRKFLEKRGEGLHHVALHVDDLTGTVERLKASGTRLISDDIKIGAGGHLYVFVHPVQHRRRAAGTGGRRSSGRLTHADHRGGYFGPERVASPFVAAIGGWLRSSATDFAGRRDLLRATDAAHLRRAPAEAISAKLR